MKKILPDFFAYFLSFLTIIILWQVFSSTINSELILASPGSVLKQIGIFITSSVFWKSLFITLVRIFCSFLISAFLGFGIGILSSWNKFLKHYFDLILVILRVTPVVSVILLVTFWLKSSNVPIFVSVLMSLPVIATGVQEGLCKKNLLMEEMAKSFQLTKLQLFLYVKLPDAIIPAKEALKSAFGLSWKVVVAGEVLCLPKSGIGTLMQRSNILLENKEVMALTVLLITFCFLTEKLVEYVFRNK